MTFENNKKINFLNQSDDNIEKKYLYNDDYEVYFYNLDIERDNYEEIKRINSIRKQQLLWTGETNKFDNEFYDDFNSDILDGKKVCNERETEKTNDLSINKDKDNTVIQLTNEKQKIDNKFNLPLNSRCIIEMYSPCIQLRNHLFQRLSVLVQDICYERFDWKDVIIARNINNDCFKIEFINSHNRSSTSSICDDIYLKIEIKSDNLTNLNIIKNEFYEIIDKLFKLYPGYFIQIREK
jgi:hypothetical protein